MLLARQWLDRAEDGLYDALERVIREREGELASLDLGQVKYVIYQAQEMSTVALNAIEHTARLLWHLAVDAVEDQEDNRQIVRDLLTANDYQLTEAENGEEALAAVAKERPVILMDHPAPDHGRL